MRPHLRKYLAHLRRVPDDASDCAVREMLDEARELVDALRVYVLLDLASDAVAAARGRPGRPDRIDPGAVRVAAQCETVRLLSLPIPAPAGGADLGFLMLETRLPGRMLYSDELRYLHRLARRLGEILKARGLRLAVGVGDGAAGHDARWLAVGAVPPEDGAPAGKTVGEGASHQGPGGCSRPGGERQAQMIESFVHDMGNLVAVIEGSARMLGREVGRSAHLHRILEADRQILEMMEALRAAGRDEIRKRWVDLGHLLRAAADLVRVDWPEGIRFELDLPQEEALVLADPVQVSRIVLNLLRNACDGVARKTSGRAPEGMVRLSLRRQDEGPSAEERVWYELCVADDGIGMDAETRRKMFLPHFTRKGAAGSGLGIAFLDCLIRELGGRITVETAPGQGTVIRILWPEIVQ
ncbi:ATP-binding protein [Rhodovulum sp. MB263]|uniref:ATP-binding protein n=1 Tax=Rhodovulum sp. (strain MB263) TaxID=308754 RepID=UPI0009B7A23E|nr:HAMP domain-containing sensor histidine kinase [Rhodovulum sp. MB263]ARC88364.1 hypothetical protein B5V46_06925 [Rhodovulum sp. MB263]